MSLSSRIVKKEEKFNQTFEKLLFISSSFFLILTSTIYSTGFVIISTRYSHSLEKREKRRKKTSRTTDSLNYCEAIKNFSINILHSTVSGGGGVGAAEAGEEESWMQSLSKKWKVANKWRKWSNIHNFFSHCVDFYFFLRLNKHEKVPPRDLKAPHSLTRWMMLMLMAVVVERHKKFIDNMKKLVNVEILNQYFFSNEKFSSLENCHFFHLIQTLKTIHNSCVLIYMFVCVYG